VYQNFKKILKIIAYLIIIPVTIFLLFIFGAWIKYTSIVASTPKNHTISLHPGYYGQYVNNFIGTGGFPAWGRGMNFPGATVPFGMVRLSPETISFYKDHKAYNTSGYYYADNKMLGFSHTRLAGTNAKDGGHFLFTPTTTLPELLNFNKDYTHYFSHVDETAFPGYYSVQFKEENIYAEITSTERTGLHRYTFKSDKNRQILIHITNTLGNEKANEGMVMIDSERKQLTGSVRTFGRFASRYGGIKVYFVAQFDQYFSDFGIWNGKNYTKNLKTSKSDCLIVNLGFDKRNKNKEVNVKVGISYVSIKNARENLAKEVGNQTFNQIVEQAKEKWEDKLSKIKIETTKEDDKIIFYSALYRSFQMPTIFNDTNGDYLGFDNKIHQTSDFTYYTDFSLWDTFRTVHPLFNILVRKEQRDMVVSLIKMAKQGGSLPRWPSGNGYTGAMIGSPADITIVESYLKGITDFNVHLAYAKMKEIALGPTLKGALSSGRRNIKGYLKYGYAPAGITDKAVSKTLEYSWADYAISRLAKELGKEEDFKLFTKHANYYKNLWNPETQYFQPRNTNGKFVEKFKPLQSPYTDWNEEYTNEYVQGSALQWRWAVPFDTKGLISLFKSRTYFVSELNDFFKLSKPQMATWIPDNYYWHGNEPDIHAAYLFNDAGRPDLTQKWVRWILKKKYKNNYIGIDGNDDAGTLSAWYVFSALGFYPIAGTEIYQLGSPLLKNAEIKIGDHKLTIITENYAPSNIYVKEVFLNDKLLNRRWINHAEIENGATLKFVMSNKPENIIE